MKNLIYFFVFIISFFWSSCNKDEISKDCTLANFVGNYAGQETCVGLGEDVIYSIKQKSGGLILIDGEGTEMSIEIDGCSLKLPEQDLIFAQVSGDGRLKGDELIVNQQIIVFGIPTNCNFKGRKQ